MKKIFHFIPLLLLAFSCNDEVTSIEDINETNEVLAMERSCGTEENLKRQIAADPSLALRMELLEQSQAKNVNNIIDKLESRIYKIPVVVNVVYRLDRENISDEQIQSQIDVLNKDFNALNSEYESVPQEFAAVKSNVGFEFELVEIKRKSTNKISWGVNDDIKTSLGIIPTKPTEYLNIWVCNIGRGSLGYGQYPGGNPLTDGVVVDSRYFGTVGTATAPYNLGRTTTHEVGHWLNLRHIWGDELCGDDYVSDTPNHNSANTHVPTFPHYSTCLGNPLEMTMNYMDYVNDEAMSMFTKGQRKRMLATLINGGPRSSYVMQ